MDDCYFIVGSLHWSNLDIEEGGDIGSKLPLKVGESGNRVLATTLCTTRELGDDTLGGIQSLHEQALEVFPAVSH